MFAERGLRAAEAAQYLGIKTVSKFRAYVKAGKLPGPLPFGQPRVWDKKALDHALDKLSGLPSKTEAADSSSLAQQAIAHGEAVVLKALQKRQATDALRNRKTKPR